MLQPLAPYLGIIEIILGVTLSVLVLMQTKGADLGGFLGGDGSTGGSFRTKRGVEMFMYRLTIGVSVAFFLVTILAFIAMGQAV